MSPAAASYSATSAATKGLGDADQLDAKLEADTNDIGITVPGSKVEQKFTTVFGFLPEVNSHTIILRLVGVVGEVEVTKPITVAHKPTCTTCGRVNKASSKFCTDCGTALVLL